MTACPICNTATEAQFRSTPYWQCPTCDLLFQDPLPPKLWHGAHEAPPDAMGDGEKQANEAVAQFLFERAMGGKR